MGIFKKLLGGGLAFNKVAKSIKYILDNISLYQMYGDIDYVYKAAWLFKYGVIDSIDKWHWSPFIKIIIPDYHSLGRITLTEVMHIVSGKIATILKTLADKEANFVQDIIDGGDAYDKVSHLVSTATKNELRP